MKKKNKNKKKVVKPTREEREKQGAQIKEYILEDNACPLAILMKHPSSGGQIIFQIRRCTPDILAIRKAKKKAEQERLEREAKLQAQMPQQMQSQLPHQMPQHMPQNMPQHMPQNMPQHMPQNMPQNTSQNMPQHMSQNIPQHMPQNMPQNMTQNMPQQMQMMTKQPIQNNGRNSFQYQMEVNGARDR